MFASIANTFANCFKIPELKSRILFTAVMLAICRLAAYMTMPGLDGAKLHEYMQHLPGAGGGALGLYNTFTGNAMENCAVGTLGIMPYISATIVMQLLAAVVPSLAKLSRENDGRVKIIKYSRYLTVLICLGQGFLMAEAWEHPTKLQFFGNFSGDLVLYKNALWWYRIQTTILLTIGTLLLMWIGEQITDRGIGNGVSLIITIGILARLPDAFTGLVDMVRNNFNIGNAIVLLVLLVLVVAGVIALTQAQRKIPVQYAQRAVGRKMYSGGTSFLPLRLNFAGVMPIIFAQAILMVPQFVFKMLSQGNLWGWDWSWTARLANDLNQGGFLFIPIYTAMILFFSYFWTATQFNELQIADDLKKNGGYVPGVRPGQATSNFLHNAMSRITLAGAIFLTVIAVVPTMLQGQMHVPQQLAQFFGGTSMLIAVGVLLDTMRQMESHLMMRHYDGFLKGGRGGGSRLRGRL